MTGLWAIGVAIALYAAIVVGVGLAATRRSEASPVDYFLAGRKLRRTVLFMALFGTNCTAFILVGIPGQAYHDGVGIFSINAPIIALGLPLAFYAIGSPARRVAIRLGALTPAELFARRFGSRGLGYVLFGIFSLYTIPYMCTAVQGAAVTLHAVTEGAIPEWAGGLGVILVALLYTLGGGMMATAWTNVVQGGLFLAVMLLAFVVMGGSMGGIEEATRKVLATDSTLLKLEGSPLYTPRGWFSWGIMISLTVIAFPHMLVRLMSANGDRALKGVTRVYPAALAVLWLAATFVGVWGAAAFPGLEGAESDRIFSLMVAGHMPAFLVPLGFLAVLAAVMSTLDAQILVLSSMLVRDVLRPLRPTQSEREEVQLGRLFALVVAGAAWALTLWWGESVFGIARLAFSGYLTMVPALFMGLRWRRFSAPAAIISILAGNAVLGLALAGSFELYGFLAPLWGFAAAAVAGIAAAFLTKPPSAELNARAFGA